MKVRTLATVTTPAGEIPAGEIITIPDTVLDRLKGKVEVVQLTPGEAAIKISKVAEELDRSGPWPDNLMQIITQDARERIQLANQAVDHAADVLKNPEALDAALKEYREAWAMALQIAQRRQS